MALKRSAYASSHFSKKRPASSSTSGNSSSPAFKRAIHKSPLASLSTLGPNRSRTRTNPAASDQRSVSRRASLPWPSSQPNLEPFDETEDEAHAREDADATNEIIMAIDMRDHGTVGCSYYTAREQKLYLMEDSKMGGIEIVKMMKLYASPTVVLISTQAEEALEDLLYQEARREDGEDNMSGQYALHTRMASEFGYESAMNRLINLRLVKNHTVDMQFITPNDDMGGEQHDEQSDLQCSSGQTARLMRLASSIDLESRFTIGCAGAVIAYIQRKHVANFGQDDRNAPGNFQIKFIEMSTIENMMFINADTLACLQIIQSENHPNPLSQGPVTAGNTSKESLSVYGLFLPLARTPQGKLKLRQMFLRPSMCLNVIEERQATITTLLMADHAGMLDVVEKSLKQIKDMRTVVTHLQKGISSTIRHTVRKGVWGSLQRFTYHALIIVEALRQLSPARQIPIISSLIETVDGSQLQAIGTSITDIIDFERSAESHRTAILPGVDPELDEIKQTYDGMDSLLTSVATALADSVPDWARQYIENCIFFPQLGFLTVVPLEPETGVGKYTGEGSDCDAWQMMFSTDAMGYFKNARMIELDGHFGDMYGMICDQEIEIIHDLAVRVLEHERLLVSVSDAYGELDCFVAMARGAQTYDLVLPHVVESNVLDIVGGRHPLQELTVRSYVANDTYLQGGSGTSDECMESPGSCSSHVHEVVPRPSCLLMTGPNYSGKSVYLKQVALIVYMAHIGSYVPAETATIGVTDKILTRIATRESVSRNQSAFMIDLQQVALAMKLATRRSLVLIDEFGKGTNSTDGAGLACGAFEYFMSLGPQRPKVIGATHFHEIFEHGFLADDPFLSFGHMEIRVDGETQIVEDQITYLYNFVPGKSISSFGTCCAAMSGIDSAIINRADDLVLLTAHGEDLVVACATTSDEELRSCEDAERIARKFLATDMPASGKSLDGNGESIKDMLEAILASSIASTVA